MGRILLETFLGWQTHCAHRAIDRFEHQMTTEKDILTPEELL